MKPTLKAPRTELLKLKYDKTLSKFAFKLNLRRYILEGVDDRLHEEVRVLGLGGRAIHSSTFWLNLSRLCH
jgi:hypothetical protein